MMVVTVVDVMSTNSTAQIANALTPIEAGLRQLALRRKMVQYVILLAGVFLLGCHLCGLLLV